MISLYFTSQGADGKTALCATLGRKLIAEGKKVGFFRPVFLVEPEVTNGDKDALFLKTTLGLSESVDILSPIRLSRQNLWHNLSAKADNFRTQLKQAYTTLAHGKDVLFMEGLKEIETDVVAKETCYQISDILNTKVIIVLRYSQNLTPTAMSHITQSLGQKLIGAVVNYVPKAKIETITEQIKTSFQKEGIKVLGCLPEDRTLLGISVAELAKSLGGEIITCPEGDNKIIENIMLGAMTPDSGIDYFSRKANKAVITRGDRADMQLAALQTSTNCLVLTGNTPPSTIIISEAKRKGIPIILVKQDTKSTVANVETALNQGKFHSLIKLEKFSQILEKYFDFQLFFTELGLKLR